MTSALLLNIQKTSSVAFGKSVFGGVRAHREPLGGTSKDENLEHPTPAPLRDVWVFKYFHGGTPPTPKNTLSTYLSGGTARAENIGGSAPAHGGGTFFS